MWNTEGQKFNTVIQGKYFFMNNYSLTENEEHGIPSQILPTIFGLHASVIFRPQMCMVSSTFVVSSDPKL